MLYDADVVARTLEECGIDPSEVVSWDLHEATPEAVALIKARFHEPAYMCDEEALIPESVAAIRRLAHMGYRVIIVTSRAAELEDSTRALVKKYMPDVSEVYLVGLGGSKVDVLKEQQAQLLIDDGPHNVEAAMEAGIPCTLISNIRTAHNHKLARKLRRRVGTRLVAASLSVVVSWFERRKPTVTDYEVRHSME